MELMGVAHEEMAALRRGGGGQSEPEGCKMLEHLYWNPVVKQQVLQQVDGAGAVVAMPRVELELRLVCDYLNRIPVL